MEIHWNVDNALDMALRPIHLSNDFQKKHNKLTNNKLNVRYALIRYSAFSVPDYQFRSI